MLSKKSIKIIAIAVLAVLMLAIMSTSCFAVAEDFEPSTNLKNSEEVKSLATTVLGYMKYIGVAIAVGMMIYLGIKYVTSSPDGKADLKGKLGVYILGLVLILAASFIVGIIENGINSATGNAGFAISTLLMH